MARPTWAPAAALVLTAACTDVGAPCGPPEAVGPGRAVAAPCEVRHVDARRACAAYRIERREFDAEGREIAFRTMRGCDHRSILDGACTTFFDGSEPWRVERRTTYHPDGTVARVEQSPPSTVVSSPFPRELEHAGAGLVDYDYEGGRRIRATTDTGAVAEYRYDALGRLDRIEPVQPGSAGADVLVAVTYGPDGTEVRRIEVPGGDLDQWTTYETTYDDAGRIATVAGSALEWTLRETYERDAAGRVVRFERRIGGSGPAYADTTTYEHRADGSLARSVTVSVSVGSDGSAWPDVVETTTFDEHGNPLGRAFAAEGTTFALAQYDYSCFE